MNPTGHAYILMGGHGEDAPGKTLDTYWYCHRCGTAKHDFRHGGGLTSPLYPVFYRARVGKLTAEPPCAEPEPAATEALRLVLRDVGDGGPGSDNVSAYTAGKVREALTAG